MSRIETKCIQEGWKPKSAEPRRMPIYQSTTFAYEDCFSMAQYFELKSSDHIYTRISNPSFEAVEAKITAMQGGVGTMITGSGMSATFAAVVNIAHAGQNIVCSSEVYGGTFNLFNKTLPELGIETRFFTPADSDEYIETLIDQNTRLIFGETLSNPSLSVFDTERYAALAHKHNIPLMMDNTFPTPVKCNPFDFGCDIIVHATTKYMDGHAAAMGGAVIDSGNFNWKASGKFPELCTPDESYHGVVYCEDFGNAAYIAKCRAHIMRDIGMTPSPFNAFLLDLGLDTLALRMDRHCENGQAVAEYLSKHPKIKTVNYPSLKDNKYYDLCMKYMPKGTCGVVSFEIEGGREAAVEFMEKLKIGKIMTHVADSCTCVLHPASTTHRQLSDQQLIDCGISPSMVRMSVGIEHIDDILEDLENALK